MLFDIKSASAETGVLLLSSFTFGMASPAMKYGHRINLLLFWLTATLALGSTFLGFEVHDFISMIHKGGPPERSGFVSAFFALVGSHGLQVTFGMIWIIVMMVQVMIFGCDRPFKDTDPPAWPVLAFPRYRLGRDLLGRLSARTGVMSKDDDYPSELRSYIFGIGFALVLSAVPFAGVAWHFLPRAMLLWIIRFAALRQIVAHQSVEVQARRFAAYPVLELDRFAYGWWNGLDH